MAKKTKTPIKKFTITLEGIEEGDIENALGEVSRLIHEGCTSGFNSNDTGAFDFESSEEDKKSLAW